MAILRRYVGDGPGPWPAGRSAAARRGPLAPHVGPGYAGGREGVTMTMTEAEWLSHDNTYRMLVYMPGKASDRKLRLLAVAWCRRAWGLFAEEHSRRAVELAERDIEGLADREAVGIAARGEAAAWMEILPPERVAAAHPAHAAWAALTGGRRDSGAATANPPIDPADAIAEAGHRLAIASTDPGDVTPGQAAIVRCIFGNPFRPVAVEPSWLAWRDRAVVKMAQAAYDDRLLPAGHLDPAGLAVLADALEDAGCTDADVLGHLRGPGPHVRGCWVVDLLLGKD